MPANFERCVKNKGRVRTKKLKGGKSHEDSQDTGNWLSEDRVVDLRGIQVRL